MPMQVVCEHGHQVVVVVVCTAVLQNARRVIVTRILYCIVVAVAVVATVGNNNLMHDDACMAGNPACRVLAHGYSLNHTALALYRSGADPAAVQATSGHQAQQAQHGNGHTHPHHPHHSCEPWSIDEFASTMQARGFAMNGEGGVVKVRVCVRATQQPTARG